MDWRVLDEPPYNRVPNPFSASSEGVKFVGNFASNSRTAEIHRQSSNAPGYIWMGNFLPGESVLWAPGTAPITLSFSQPLAAVGAQVQPNFYGEFVAQIDVYRGTTRVATFTTPGNGTNKEDGSAAFIGVKDDSGATITSVVFSLLSCQSSCSDFAINQVSFR